MNRIMATAIALAAIGLPANAPAQEGALGGAMIGPSGATTAAVAATGSPMQPRGKGYYWYNGRCWAQILGGQYRLVAKHHCN
jgi:hypothetical protein